MIFSLHIFVSIMIDLNFYRQVSDCKKGKKDEISDMAKTILSQRTARTRKRMQKMIDENTAKCDLYSNNGILEYMDEYEDYFY